MPGTGRWSRGALAAALAAALLAACAGDDTVGRPRPASRPGTAVVTNLSDMAGVNPLVVKRSAFDRDISWLLFSRLVYEEVDLGDGPPGFEPRLAESWERSEDGLALTFRLREGLEWSDGAPLTAEDVRWTWQAQTHPDVAWAHAESKERIADVEVVDARTVRFAFTEAYPDQLADANQGVVLPRHAWGERPFEEWRGESGWFRERLVSSGPFVLESWTPNQEIVLRRNERFYLPGLPRLDKLVFRIVPEKIGQIQQLLGGAVDYVQIVPHDQLPRLERFPEIAVDDYWGLSYDYVAWNLEHPLLADVEVRRALTHAIDRRLILDTLYGGFGRIAVSPILSTTWGFHPGLEPRAHDPRLARLVLAKRGFADADGDGTLELDGRPLAFELLVQSGARVQMDVATMIQEQLARVGAEARIRPLEFKTWLERVTAHDFEATLGGWNIDTTLDLSYAFHSEAVESGYNFGKYANPEVDRLIDEAELEADLEAKRVLLHRLQEILYRELPYTFLWESKRLNARQRRLHGTRPDARSAFSGVEQWWVED